MMRMNFYAHAWPLARLCSSAFVRFVTIFNSTDRHLGGYVSGGCMEDRWTLTTKWLERKG